MDDKFDWQDELKSIRAELAQHDKNSSLGIARLEGRMKALERIVWAVSLGVLVTIAREIPGLLS